MLGVVGEFPLNGVYARGVEETCEGEIPRVFEFNQFLEIRSSHAQTLEATHVIVVSLATRLKTPERNRNHSAVLRV